MLYQVACHSAQERLWITMSPGWSTRNEDDWDEKVHDHFWSEATTYGKYAACPIVGLPSPAHLVWIGGTMWSGRYYGDTADEPEEGADDAVPWEPFDTLSGQAVDSLTDHTKPPEWRVGPWDELESGSNAWLNTLYTVFAHEPERWNYHPNFPFPMQPGETFFVVGLPCNVYLASARAIELLIDRDEGLAERTADSETDSAKLNALRVPDNPEILRLAKKIRQERQTGATMKEIAIDFTDGDETKAESLLRQLRRYRNLLR
ncbi:hypothetical protein ACFL5Q_04525 [Planctomycetota bacterium]